MPIPFAAFLPLIGAGVNAASQALTNSSNKKTALQMYSMQRADALADWNKQNQYNSPQAQMQRYKEAGLSPHLIYGQTNTAPAVRSSNVDTPKYQAPQIDPNSMNVPALGLQLQIQQQQLANLKTQEDLMKAEEAKKKSETDYRKLVNEFYDMSFYNRLDTIASQNLLTSSRQRLTEQQISTEQNRTKNILESTRQITATINMIQARTGLTNEQAAQVKQLTENLKLMNSIYKEKAQQEQFETEFFQKIRAFGIVGQMAYQLARAAK